MAVAQAQARQDRGAEADRNEALDRLDLVEGHHWLWRRARARQPLRHYTVLIKQMPRVLDQLSAGLREMRALAEPLHQRDVETLLQLLDLVRDRGLRQG